MDEKYPLKVYGVLNSMIHPLLSALIFLDDLIRIEFEDIEIRSSLLEIMDQLQSATEYFLELSSLTSIEIKKITPKRDQKHWRSKRLFTGIFILTTQSL